MSEQTYFDVLRDEVHALRRIVRAAAEILTDDDDYATVRKRFEGGLRDRYREARADFVRRFQRSP